MFNNFLLKEVLEHAADIGLDNPGGRGAVREAIEYILAAQDKWEKIVASYEQAGQGDRQ